MFSMTDEEKSQLEALDAGRELDAELEEEVEQEEEVVEDEPVVEEVEEPVVEPEPVVEEIKAPEEPKPDAAAFARMRYELKRKEEELARVTAQPAAVQQKVAEELTFDEAFQQVRQELIEVKQKLAAKDAVEQRSQAVSAAAQEYVNEYERPYAEKTPDYGNAAAHVTHELSRAYRLLNPAATTGEVKQYCDNYVLTRASQAVNQGMNPAEYLHHVAYKEFGYAPKKSDPVSQNDNVRKPDLTKVAANKARSAGMAAANGGRGKEDLTAEAALEMSNAEFSRLSPGDIDRLLAQA